MTRRQQGRTNVVELAPSTRPYFERARAALRAVVAAKGLHMTRVREAILRAALECREHFDAPQLASRCGLPHSTVYRNMPLLVEARIARPALVSQGDHRLYEVMFERPSHEHLICRVCGRVDELRVEALEALRRDIAMLYGFELDTYVHEMIGVCAACSTKERR